MADPVPIWVRAIHELRGEDHRLWAYLRWRQGGNGHAWPSQEAIASDLGLTVEGVRKITRRLVDSGWLSLTRPDTTGRQHTIHYSVVCPQTPNERTPFNREKPPTSVHPFGEETPNERTGKPPTAVGVNTYNEHIHIDAAQTRITFDAASGRFVGLPPAKIQAWSEAYPDVDVDQEIVRAGVWYGDHPARAKKDLVRFVGNWIRRASSGFGRTATTATTTATTTAPVRRGPDGLTARERALQGVPS